MCSIQEHFSVTVLRILVLRVRKQPAGRGLERSRPVAVALCSKAVRVLRFSRRSRAPSHCSGPKAVFKVSWNVDVCVS